MVLVCRLCSLRNREMGVDVRKILRDISENEVDVRQKLQDVRDDISTKIILLS